VETSQEGGVGVGTPRKKPKTLEASALGPSDGRLHYIDWLRVLAVLLLFPFHTLRVFNADDPFYVKANTLSMPVSYLLGFISVWHMQLLFLLAGASTCLALRRRSNRQYLGERLLRLGIPFLFGIFVLIPPQTYDGARFNSGYTSSYWHYLSSGDFLQWNVKDGGDYYGGFGIGHLWFILILLLVSVVVLPLFAWGRGERGGAFLRGFSRRLAHPAWWLLAALLLFVFEALPDPTGLGFFYYLMFFALGYAAVRGPEFMAAAKRLRLPALALGLPLAAFWSLSSNYRDSLPDPSWQRAGLAYLGMLASLLVIIGLLGYGRRYLDRTSPALAYLAEGSYPVYILHQTVIVLFAFSLVGWAVWEPLQWVALLAVSVVVTFALYEGVRRWSVTRFLFGMRPKKRRTGEVGGTGPAGVVPARPTPAE
jgi:peptidoglycan/LPS O-acetylase OafA/YrhL